MQNITVKLREGESRKDYLIRVTVAYLKHVDHTGHFSTGYPDTINYDEADCDGSCLANDLEAEFPEIVFDDYNDEF